MLKKETKSNNCLRCVRFMIFHVYSSDISGQKITFDRDFVWIFNKFNISKRKTDVQSYCHEELCAPTYMKPM